MQLHVVIERSLRMQQHGVKLSLSPKHDATCNGLALYCRQVLTRRGDQLGRQCIYDAACEGGVFLVLSLLWSNSTTARKGDGTVWERHRWLQVGLRSKRKTGTGEAEAEGEGGRKGGRGGSYLTVH